jgi:hypothetical protein
MSVSDENEVDSFSKLKDYVFKLLTTKRVSSNEFEALMEMCIQREKDGDPVFEVSLYLDMRNLLIIIVLEKCIDN